MEMGFGLARPATQLPQPRMQSGPVSTGASSVLKNSMAPDSGVEPAAIAPVEDSGTAESLAQEKAYAKVMQDKFNQDCQTCKNRRYQDGSNDPGVSFKTPTHIDPSVSASAVMSHEQEHVSRNKASAEAEGGEVISSTVVLHSAVCPECGRNYVSGGTTYTTTRTGGAKPAPNAAKQGGGLDISV